MAAAEEQTILAVDIIRMDGGTQPRAELNQSHVEELVEVLNEGHTFKDPVIVFYDGTDYWLADGFHRINATKRTEYITIHADVRSGTLEDAIAYSCGANATHGLRRTNEDKQRAVNRLLTILRWQEESNVRIAAQCGVTEHLVRIVKDSLPEEHPASTKSRNRIKQPVEPVEEVEEVRIRTSDIDAEKRQKVEQWFEDFPTLWHLSNREIARRCDVTEGLVRKIRKEVEEQRSLATPEPVEEPTPEIESIPEPEPEQIGNSEPETSYATIEDLFPGFTAWKNEQKSEPVPEAEAEVAVETVEDIFDDDHIDEEKTIDTDPALPVYSSIPTPEPEAVPMPVKQEQEHEHQIQPEEPIKETEYETIANQILVEVLQRERERELERELEREIKREQVREHLAQLKEKGVELPVGKYSCLVIDPPWKMEKIEREERPNQMEFEYPTMTEEELKAFPLPSMAADNCHLYLWTTQKHLPLALRLAEHWGFKYQCLMTWVKNVGFTPFSWMYSTEHVLFCTKGSLPLLEKGRRLDFGGKVREHSRKPDEFYDLVRAVSPGPRLDIFSREKREDFDQFGNEVDKYDG